MSMADGKIDSGIDRSKLRASMAPVTAADRDFWEGTKAAELRLHGGPSGAMHFPQLSCDPRTLSTQMEWKKASGRGRLWSWIVMHQRYLPAFADAGPYVVGMIELEEGAQIISGLVGPLDELRCDAPVEVVFDALDDERTLPLFRIVA
jgi:uncharacterized OB-fold protein